VRTAVRARARTSGAGEPDREVSVSR